MEEGKRRRNKWHHQHIARSTIKTATAAEMKQHNRREAIFFPFPSSYSRLVPEMEALGVRLHRGKKKIMREGQTSINQNSKHFK